MKSRSLLIWSICILVALVASCNSQASGSQANPTPTPVSMATPGCDNGFSHLAIGETITVIEVGHPNRIRSTPHVTNDNIIGQISSGMTGKIVDGPVCLDGLVFWKIDTKAVSSGSGWTAEGDGTNHWLEQYQP